MFGFAFNASLSLRNVHFLCGYDIYACDAETNRSGGQFFVHKFTFRIIYQY